MSFLNNFKCIFLTVLLAACNNTVETEAVSKIKAFAFGTWVEITIVGLPKQQLPEVETALNLSLQKMHNNWHAWRPGELGKINQAFKDGTSIVVDSQMKQLIEMSISMEKSSQGMFNPAIGNLLNLWGFQRDDPFNVKQIPSKQQIESYLLNRPSTTQLTFKENALTSKNSLVKLDFGGFAKGFGVELILQQLKHQGFNNVLVNAGGDLMVSGNASNRPWQIAITDPFSKAPLAFIEIENHSSKKAIFTSGNYERGFTVNGKKYHHILNPLTGYPSKGIASATVIGSNGAWSDAAATSMIIAGIEESFKIASKMKIENLLLITDDGQFHMDSGMLQKLKFIGDKPKHIFIHSLTTN